MHRLPKPILSNYLISRFNKLTTENFFSCRPTQITGRIANFFLDLFVYVNLLVKYDLKFEKY